MCGACRARALNFVCQAKEVVLAVGDAVQASTVQLRRKRQKVVESLKASIEIKADSQSRFSTSFKASVSYASFVAGSVEDCIRIRVSVCAGSADSLLAGATHQQDSTEGFLCCPIFFYTTVVTQGYVAKP